MKDDKYNTYKEYHGKLQINIKIHSDPELAKMGLEPTIQAAIFDGEDDIEKNSFQKRHWMKTQFTRLVGCALFLLFIGDKRNIIYLFSDKRAVKLNKENDL